jgi:hypothetical protein
MGNALFSDSAAAAKASPASLSSYWESTEKHKVAHKKAAAKLSKSEVLQSKLNAEISARQADIQILRLSLAASQARRAEELAAKNKEAAFLQHQDCMRTKQQIDLIDMCIRRLTKERTAMYTHAMHQDTMKLMKETARHFVKDSAGMNADHAVGYADALADAHVSMNEVGDIITQDDTASGAEVDDEWLQLCKQLEPDHTQPAQPGVGRAVALPSPPPRAPTPPTALLPPPPAAKTKVRIL